MYYTHFRYDGCGRPTCGCTRVYPDPFERYPYDDYYYYRPSCGRGYRYFY